MAVDRSYVEANAAERGRLEGLVRRLTDADLGRETGAGWTVAGVLAHLAFWDQRILVLLEAWQRTGRVPASLDHDAVDWINDTAKPLCLALAPRTAAELAVTIARTVDERVAALPDRLLEANAAAGGPVNLLRATHRHEHLGEIERTLGR